MIHRLMVRVYYEDTDSGGVVYHARYLAFAERARTEAMRELGATHTDLAQRLGLIFVVRRAEMDYLRPARLDDEVVVLTGPWELRGASVGLRQVFEVAGQQVGVLRVRLAAVHAGTGRPMRLPGEWVAAMQDKGTTSESSG